MTNLRLRYRFIILIRRANITVDSTALFVPKTRLRFWMSPPNASNQTLRALYPAAALTLLRLM
jgi:hypothetical protein